MDSHEKKDLYAVTALTKTEHAEAAGNACHCVMIMSNISALNFLSHLMYVTDALTENRCRLEKRFYKVKRKLRQDTENRCLNQEQGFNLTENEREYIDGIVSPTPVKRAIHKTY